MTTRPFFICIALFASACGASSNYVRAPGASQEIYWNYSAGLTALQGGKEIASGGTWSGLSEAVACVPEASAFADGVAGRMVAGHSTWWTGLTVGIGGTVAGTAMVIQGLEEKDLVPGFATMAGSFATGLLLTAIGSHLLGTANADAVDAVNAYNDQHQETTGCPR